MYEIDLLEWSGEWQISNRTKYEGTQPTWAEEEDLAVCSLAVACA